MSENQSPEEVKEPSLAPACLVIVILSLATFSAVCGFGSWFYFSDQYPLATKSINTQLIPWIRSSQLSASDQTEIIAELQNVLPRIESRELNSRQLTRLRNCLLDNPVLLWGCVETIIAEAPEAGLSDTEQQALVRVSQRLLRSAAIRKLSRKDLEFTFQGSSQVRKDGQSVEVIGPLTAEQVREFMERAEQIADRYEIPNEPYEQTPAEAFHVLIDAALTVQSQ